MIVPIRPQSPKNGSSALGLTRKKHAAAEQPSMATKPTPYTAKLAVDAAGKERAEAISWTVGSDRRS